MSAGRGHPTSETAARFDNTHWSVILPAVHQETPGARQALEDLCQAYWSPLYAYLRGKGHSPEDAKDLTQGFFVHLLTKDRLQQVHPARGRFRSFLLACLKHYVQNQRDRDQAFKRGGGQVLIPIDVANAEEQTHFEPVERQDPALAYERQWASTLIQQVLQKLQDKCQKTGRPELFNALEPFLVGEAKHGDYDAVAAQLGMNPDAVRTAASRLRRDFRSLLRAEVGRTVANPSEIEDEIRYLFTVSRRT